MVNPRNGEGKVKKFAPAAVKRLAMPPPMANPFPQMRFHPLLRRAFLLLALFAGTAAAHPVPDVPVRAYFQADGACSIHVEVDPRCFKDDPENAPSLLNGIFKEMPEADRAAYLEKARAFVPETAEFRFEPLGRIIPELKWEWTTKGGAPLTKDDDVVVLTGIWRTQVPAGIQGYRLRALPQGKLSVLFLNHLNGKSVERIAVLFPGETSYLLNLTGLDAPTPSGPIAGAVGQKGGAAGWWATFADFFEQGFLHVLPKGLDHILFVLGLFLLRREWKPLLWQVSTFTVAHTITLGLATIGWVAVSPRVVEPVIAASLVYVALENIFRPQYTVWRLLVVFIFGLVHGLGFAGALRELALPTASLLVGLLGFNVGVEGGQLAVISLAFIATAWIRNPVQYRRAIVIPGSAAIAAMGLWWTVTRVFGEG
jgi:hypothetical protein